MSVDNHPLEAVIDPPVEAVAPVAAPRVLGRLQEFDPRVDNMSTYLERLELYFDANAVEASRKVTVLLTVIGSKTYDTLWSLLAPTLLRDKTFPELLVILKDPKHLVIGERFHFYRRNQKSMRQLQNIWLICGSSVFAVNLVPFWIKCFVTASFVECVTTLSRRSS